MAHMQPLAFLPAMTESVMDELRTTEGMLFRDEGAKKLFLDVKSLVLESLGSAQATFAGELYETVLDRYVAWDAAVASEELQRADVHFQDIAVRLTPVTVLYAKYLYAGAAPLRIRKPRLDALLRGMFTRLARLRHVRTGAFFELSPLQQDFVLRDMFRQTLATDCISIVQRLAQPPAAATTGDDADDADTAIVTPAPAEAAPAAAATITAAAAGAPDADAAAAGAPDADAAATEEAHSNQLPQSEPALAPSRAASVVAPPSTIVHTRPDDAATQAFVREMSDDNDVYPDDSISRVLDRGRPFAAGEAAAGAAAAATAAAAAAAGATSARERGSVASHASVRSRMSQFHMPKDVRRVLLSDAASEVRSRVGP